MKNLCELDDLSGNLTQLNLQEDNAVACTQHDFVIVIEGQELVCNRELLRKNSKFFEAFFNFDPDKESIQIQGGGLDYDSCRTLLKFWETSQLDASVSNIQQLLLGLYSRF
jgi:hypothetical protein